MITVGTYFAPNRGSSYPTWVATVERGCTAGRPNVAHGMTNIVHVRLWHRRQGHRRERRRGPERIHRDNIGMLLRGHVTNATRQRQTRRGRRSWWWPPKKSGTGVGDMAAGDNLFAIRNNGDALHRQGNGNFHYDGTGAAYFDYDDIKLLRAPT